MGETATLKPRGSKVPHVFIILLSIIVFCGIMTYVVPAGKYERVKANNVQVVNPDSFKRIPQTPVNPFQWLVAIPDGFVAGGTIIASMFICVAAMGMFTSTGAFNRFFGSLARSGKKSRIGIMAVIMAYMYIHAGLTGAVTAPIGYTPVIVFLAVVCGYSKVLGVVMVSGCVMTGFGLGPTNPTTVVIAQQIAELPIYSGLGYRVSCWLVFLAVTLTYMIATFEKYRKKTLAEGFVDPEDQAVLESGGNVNDPVTARDIRIIVGMIACLVVVIVLTVIFKLNIQGMSALYLISGVVGGFLAGYTPREICVKFTDGARSVILGALVVAMARAIPIILTKGNIIDTIIYYSASSLKGFPKSINAVIMLFVQTFINFFISSGSGQAAATMPIVIPLSDMIGVSRQTAILAYQMGDGFSNMIFPTSTSIMGYVAAGGVDYGKYLKNIFPFFLLVFFLGCAALLVASAIGYQ
jgi:uncharacterized ion transporter superfamily protein YfcC